MDNALILAIFFVVTVGGIGFYLAHERALRRLREQVEMLSNECARNWQVRNLTGSQSVMREELDTLLKHLGLEIRYVEEHRVAQKRH